MNMLMKSLLLLNKYNDSIVKEYTVKVSMNEKVVLPIGIGRAIFFGVNIIKKEINLP